MSELRIRDFQPEDSTVLGRLFYETIHTVNPRDYSPAQIDAWAPEIPAPKRWIERTRTRIVVIAEDESGVVGFAELRPADCFLDCLYVRHDAQRRGIGTALVREIEARARAQHIVTLLVDVSITARPFFEHHGYTMITPREVEVRGVKLANFRMEKSFPADAVRGA